jgi:hypothetical protein
VIAIDSHAIFAFLQSASVRSNVEVFADLRKIQEFFQAVKVNIPCRVEGIRSPPGRLLIESNTEFALADSTVGIRTSSKATLVRALVRVTASAVGWDSLHPKLQTRPPRVGTAGTMERVFADVLDHLTYRECVKRIELTMFSVLKHLITSFGVNGSPRSRSRLERRVEFGWVESSDILCAFVARFFLHTSYLS